MRSLRGYSDPSGKIMPISSLPIFCASNVALAAVERPASQVSI
jgi:hypothetical protein